MPTDRHRRIEKYLGFELVAAKYEGGYKGKAWGRKAGELAHAQGTSLDDVIGKLRAAVDSPELRERFKDFLVRRHGEFLRRKGINIDQASATELLEKYEKRHRQPDCYECHSSLDNEIDLECVRCNWIVCTGCGACGCGHPHYGPAITARVARTARTKSESVVLRSPSERIDNQIFETFTEARQFAAAHPGTTLQRSGQGTGWVVTGKSDDGT